MVQQIADLATAVGVACAALALLQARKQRVHEFEMSFVHRYWAIMDRLSFALHKGDQGTTLSDDDAKAVWAYLTLCEDELDVRGQGLISDQTWSIWISGIQAQVQEWPYCAALQRVVSQQDGGEGRFEQLRALVAHSCNGMYDPMPLGVLRRAASRLQRPRGEAQRDARCTCQVEPSSA